MNQQSVDPKVYELDREYTADEIGHFRTFVAMTLNEPKLNIFQILFGASDKSGRYNPKITNRDTAGIAVGKGGGYWEFRVDFSDWTPTRMFVSREVPG